MGRDMTPDDLRRAADLLRKTYGNVTFIPEEFEELASQLEKLKSDNAKMRECLEWYIRWTDVEYKAQECLSKLGSGSDES